MRHSRLHPRGLVIYTFLPVCLSTVPAQAPLSIDQAYIITLHPQQSLSLARAATLHLGLPSVALFPAINATQALRSVHNLSLYSRYLLHFEQRHDHMQLSNAPMLGCLLSHMTLWESVQPNQTIAIFEEDAYFDQTSTLRLQRLMADLEGVPWDILMLESGSVIASGRWRLLGPMAATCAQPPCSWFGTRGYFIRHKAAQQLLRNAYPISVQVAEFCF